MEPTPATAPVVTPSTARPRLLERLARRWPTALGVAATGASLAVVAPIPTSARTWLGAACLLAAAVIYLVWGAARGELGERRWRTAQTIGVVGFGAVALAVVVADPAAARYVLAAGWIAHAAWDVVHHHAGRVVPRWYAETCMACDLTVAAVLLTVGLG
ncbi:MAG: hypothetical protein ACTHJJ_14810 [Intrasporangium sp.]|uniref:hypothetical protein n=1 Tax=Intrasporangium sp. TaxID=1925024 RepID=UPI003F7EB693